MQISSNYAANNKLTLIQQRYRSSTPINTVIMFVPQQEVSKKLRKKVRLGYLYYRVLF